MSHKRDTANVLYEILAGESVPAARLDRTSAWFEQLATPIDKRSFIAYVQVLQRGLPRESALAGLVPKWRHARRGGAGFSAGAADAFLEDYLACLDPNLLFRAPITVGYARWDKAQLQAGFAYASENENTWSLLYCDTGGARLRGGGRDLPVQSGQVLLVAPGALYTLQTLRRFNEWGYFWAVFHPDSRWRDWLNWPRFATHVSHLSLPIAVGKQVGVAFRELMQCLQSEQAMGVELAHNLLEQLILRCRASLPADFRSHRDPRIERARKYIEQHSNETFTLAEVASAANISASRLAGLFREQCGLSVLGYRDELRMVQAAQLLRNRALGIAEIGARVGYPDPAYFSRTFSRHLGVSPREYQNQR